MAAHWWMTSPGAPTGIGPIAEIGPGGAHAGRIVGAVPALRFLGDVAAPLAGAAIAHRQKKIRDFNDAETDDIEGASRGRVLTGARPYRRRRDPRWAPSNQPWTWTVDPSGGVTPP